MTTSMWPRDALVHQDAVPVPVPLYPVELVQEAGVVRLGHLAQDGDLGFRAGRFHLPQQRGCGFGVPGEVADALDARHRGDLLAFASS